MISRGLAKSGSREPYYADGSNGERPDRANGEINRLADVPVHQAAGRTGEVRFMPGCLVISLILSITLTILVNLIIRIL